MDLEVRIAWNLVGWSKTAFWAIDVVSLQGTLENGKFLHLVPKNYDFAVYSNFFFLNNFLLKIQNKVSLVSGCLLRLEVYDSAFNSNLPFLVNFSILLPNRVISAN